MSDYTKSTNFATKDNLSSGNPLKIVKGTEIDTEFNNIQTAIATKLDSGGTTAVANGGTGATTAAGARASLLPTFASNVGKVLAVNSSATDVEFIAAGGSGTVTSVSGSGGSTGLTLTGGAITTSGTLTLGGTLAVASGGTGSSSLSGAGIPTLSATNTFSGTNNFTTVKASTEFILGTTAQVVPYTAKQFMVYDPATEQGVTMKASTGTFTANAFVFINSSNNVSGSIFQQTSSVQYLTTSDYRTKNSITPMTGALNKVALLKPCTFKWNSDNSDSQGFIAHELQAVVKECVVGEKDALNADGSIKAQGIDTSFLVATLTAAIQELKALVDAQAVRITALESK